MKMVIVIGGNFVGMIVVLEFKRKGKDNYCVLVVDKLFLFFFILFLIWVFFGRWEIKDIFFWKDEIFCKKGVEFF